MGDYLPTSHVIDNYLNYIFSIFDDENCHGNYAENGDGDDVDFNWKIKFMVQNY